jgi:hypothetical protein
VMDERIAQWRRIAQDASVSSERRVAADQEFEKSLAWFRALQSSEVLASSVSDLLQRAATADSPIATNISGFRRAHRSLSAGSRGGRPATVNPTIVTIYVPAVALGVSHLDLLRPTKKSANEAQTTCKVSKRWF